MPALPLFDIIMASFSPVAVLVCVRACVLVAGAFLCLIRSVVVVVVPVVLQYGFFNFFLDHLRICKWVFAIQLISDSW